MLASGLVDLPTTYSCDREISRNNREVKNTNRAYVFCGGTNGCHM